VKPHANCRAKRETTEQARAWLRTVLQPLSRMASVTRHRLEQGSLTYRQHLQGFELLGSSASAISPTVRLHFEQASRYLPKLRDLVSAYDDALVSLRDACREAERALREPPAVAAAAARHTEPMPSLVAYLAEYTVNGHVELPAHYTLRDLWTREGAALLALRSGELAKQFAAVEAATRVAREATVALDDFLRETMLDLADRHGLPVIELDIAS
jgi:hypothetical protein